MLDEVSLRQEASQVDGRWARTHGKFVHIFPLTDPEDYFSGQRELVVSHPPELFREAVRLPDPPEGFHPLAQMVMTGNLHHAPMIVSACNTLWSGLVRWAEERSYTLVASQDIPF